MTGATRILAQFTSRLSYRDIPEAAIHAAKSVAVDAVAVGLYGSTLPWSGAIVSTVLDAGVRGPSPILDRQFTRTTARNAALANGAFIHSFEFDSLRYPNAGVHAGSTIWPAVLAVGSKKGVPGTTALAGLVAGCEVAFRIGLAGGGSFEALGFHAPGVTGVFGAAAAAGRMLNLDAGRMASAFGIAGSLCSGLLAFSKAERGGAVKPLHMGRAAEAGILAAELAFVGLEGPSSILEGRFGVLDAYARDAEVSKLCEGLGMTWQTETVCIKKYPCHVMAQTIVQGVREIVNAHRVEPSAVERFEIGAAEKVLSHHSLREPRDVSTSQYSIPMCAAIALHRDPLDPTSFLSSPHDDPTIRDCARRIELTLLPETRNEGFELASRVMISLKSGEKFIRETKAFDGMSVARAGDLAREKFQMLTAHLPERAMDEILAKLTSLEQIEDLSLLLPEGGFATK